MAATASNSYSDELSEAAEGFFTKPVAPAFKGAGALASRPKMQRQASVAVRELRQVFSGQKQYSYDQVMQERGF